MSIFKNYICLYIMGMEVPHAGPPREGETKAFCPGPHSAHVHRKDQYTLIEQSHTLLKQSLHIFCPGTLKLS